jgi:serine/threonine-protein kinase
MDGQTDTSALVGRVLGGKFELRRWIGAGAAGAVFEALQVSLQRTVAVKVLHPEHAGDEGVAARFHGEARAASRLNHPNTISIIDYGRSNDGLLYIAMEFLQGRTLTEILAAEQPLALPRVCTLMAQILAGLHEAHTAGVVHADLKADNVVVQRRRDGSELATVVDFGIARLVGAGVEGEGEDDTICGTPEYMAPEVIRGQRATPASDIYAAGVLLYELLVGEPPFTGAATPLDLLLRHLRERPVAPSQRLPRGQVPAAVEEICLRALAKEPGERFTSAAEFRQALRQAVATAEEALPAARAVLCAGCGVLGDPASVFCIDCGQPRATAAAPGATGPAQQEEDLEFDSSPYISTDLSVHGSGPATAASPTGPAAPVALFPLPFTGREPQLAAVARFLQQGGTPVLEVLGPAGSGRSRLLHEALDRSASSRRSYWCYPDPWGMAAPLYPLRSLLAAILGVPAVCTYHQLQSAVAALGLTAQDTPGIAEVFGYESELWQLDPHIRSRGLHDAIVRLLVAACARHGAVLIFEDADRHDEATRAVLLRLARCSDAALRVIVTATEPILDTWPANRVQLDRLDDAALAELAAHLQRAGAPLRTSADLHSLAGGMPARIGHLLRCQLEGGEQPVAPPQPADLIATRLRLLPPEAQRVLQSCAVLGWRFTREQLHELTGDALDREAVERGIEMVQARQLITGLGHRLGFEQLLVRDVSYESTPAEYRRLLHARAAELLQASSRDAAVLGHHCDQGGDLSRAAILLASAGDLSVRQLDDAGACRLYSRALRATRMLLLQGDDEVQRLHVEISIKLAEAMRETRNHGLRRAVLEEARSYCIGAGGLEAQLLRALAHLELGRQAHEAALAALNEALALAGRTGNRDLLCEIYLDLSATHMDARNSSAAVTVLEEGLLRVTGDAGAAAAAGPALLWRLAQLYRNKLPDHALHLAEAALVHARRAGSGLGVGRVHALLAELCEQQGRYQDAALHSKAAVEEMRRYGDPRRTVDLLLGGARATSSMVRITPDALHGTDRPGTAPDRLTQR